MLVELEVTKTADGVGFRFEELDSGQLSVVEVFHPSLDLKQGDVLLSISGVGLRGLFSADVAERLDSIPPETPFSLFVGRKPSSADWEKYGGPTKDDLRKKIWDKMEKENIADFPRPCHHRIPNFKGSKGACDRLLSLPEFVSAKTIKINPDKPQQHARFLTLQQRKKLLVPTPRLRSGLFNHIQPPEAPSAEVLKRCCTAQGVKEFGLPIPLESKMHVDLVVIGSVVVSKRGFRIGKGEGFADMEWAMMASTGAVGPDTIIVTVVHDEQMMDIPPFLVDSHDMTVDYILTPTRILQCEENLPRPTGIIWDKLTAERINEIPILRKILDMDKDKGKSIALKSSAEVVRVLGGGGRGSSGGRGRGRRGRGGSVLKASAEDWEGGAGGRGGMERNGRGGSSGERGRGGRGARGGGGGNNDLCFSCQSPGHWYRDCPNRDEVGSGHGGGEREGGGGGPSRGLNRTVRGYRGERGGGWGGGFGGRARGGGPVH